MIRGRRDGKAGKALAPQRKSCGDRADDPYVVRLRCRDWSGVGHYSITRPGDGRRCALKAIGPLGFTSIYRPAAPTSDPQQCGHCFDSPSEGCCSRLLGADLFDKMTGSIWFLGRIFSCESGPFGSVPEGPLFYPAQANQPSTAQFGCATPTLRRSATHGNLDLAKPLPSWLRERNIGRMKKCLTITLDDRVLYSGEVVEYQVAENDQKITVTGVFVKGPGLLEQLTAAAQANSKAKTQDKREQLSHSDSVDPSQAALEAFSHKAIEDDDGDTAAAL